MNYEDLIFDIGVQRTYYHVKKLLDREGFGSLLNAYIAGYSGKVKIKKRFIFTTSSLEGKKTESSKVRRSRLLNLVTIHLRLGASEREITEIFKEEIKKVITKEDSDEFKTKKAILIDGWLEKLKKDKTISKIDTEEILIKMARVWTSLVVDRCIKCVNDFSDKLSQDKIKNLNEYEKWMLLSELVLFISHSSDYIIWEILKDDRKTDIFMDNLLDSLIENLSIKYAIPEDAAAFENKFINVFKRDRTGYRKRNTPKLIFAFCVKCLSLIGVTNETDEKLKWATEDTGVIAEAVMDLNENLLAMLKKNTPEIIL